MFKKESFEVENRGEIITIEEGDYIETEEVREDFKSILGMVSEVTKKAPRVAELTAKEELEECEVVELKDKTPELYEIQKKLSEKIISIFDKIGIPDAGMFYKRLGTNTTKLKLTYDIITKYLKLGELDEESEKK